MTASEPTTGQVERIISQNLQNFYRERIGQRPAKVICQMFDKKVSVVLEDTVSPAERTLLDAGREESANRLRAELCEIIKPQLKTLIAEITESDVIVILMDFDLKSGYSSVTAILAEPPSVRDPESIPKAKKEKRNEQQ
jgi:uncharacterized protein YbcI